MLHSVDSAQVVAASRSRLNARWVELGGFEGILDGGEAGRAFRMPLGGLMVKTGV